MDDYGSHDRDLPFYRSCNAKGQVAETPTLICRQQAGRVVTRTLLGEQRASKISYSRRLECTRLSIGFPTQCSALELLSFLAMLVALAAEQPKDFCG
jgi:hypothetical protein